MSAPSPTPPPPPEDDAAKVLARDLESLETELARQKDIYLRLAADFDNFRKRTSQDIDRRSAAQKDALIRELLPIVDNLERALAGGNVSASHEKLCQGVEMTLHQLRQVLHRHGVEAEDSFGRPFDPHRHEAVRTRRDESRPDNVVLEVFEPGYHRGQEVLRPAKVVVNDLNQPAADGPAPVEPADAERPVHHRGGKKPEHTHQG
jgi:molecular chaperone GrpE